jgi:hypothetical protein
LNGLSIEKKKKTREESSNPNPIGPAQFLSPFFFLSPGPPLLSFPPAWATRRPTSLSPARAPAPLLSRSARLAPRVSTFFSLSFFLPGAQRPEIPGDLPSPRPARQGSAAALQKEPPEPQNPNPTPASPEDLQHRRPLSSSALSPRPRCGQATPPHLRPPQSPCPLPHAIQKLPEPSICTLSPCIAGNPRRSCRR